MDVIEQRPVTSSAPVKWTKRDTIVSTLALITTIAISVAGVISRDQLMNVTGIAGYSLLGMLVISFAAGSLLSFMAVPVPYWLLVFTLPTILASKWGMLAPISVGLISALGATLGHMPTFLLGYGGSTISQKVLTKFDSPFQAMALGWAKKHGAWASFFISAVFNPIHLPMIIAMGALRYSPLKFFIYSFLGNTAKSMVLAFAGYYGLNSLLRYMGI